jgi:hypothetical protein
MHYIEHSRGLCTELYTDNCRFCRFSALMKSLANSFENVRSSVFLKSNRVDSETEEGGVDISFHDVVLALTGVLTNALYRAF